MANQFSPLLIFTNQTYHWYAAALVEIKNVSSPPYLGVVIQKVTGKNTNKHECWPTNRVPAKCAYTKILILFKFKWALACNNSLVSIMLACNNSFFVNSLVSKKLNKKVKIICLLAPFLKHYKKMVIYLIIFLLF